MKARNLFAFCFQNAHAFIFYLATVFNFAFGCPLQQRIIIRVMFILENGTNIFKGIAVINPKLTRTFDAAKILGCRNVANFAIVGKESNESARHPGQTPAQSKLQ